MPINVPLNPLSDSDVVAFKRYVKKWQRILNLMDWRIEPGTKRSKYMAEVEFKLPDRLARYRVGANFGSAKVTPESLESTALHEVLHVFLYEFKAFAQAGASEDDIMSAEHRIVNTLEKLLLTKESNEE